MSPDSAQLSLLADVLGVLAVGVAFLQWAVPMLSRLTGRRVLGLAPRQGVDLVLTTSNVSISAVGASVSRPLTGLGQVLGANSCAMALSRYYRRELLDVHLSVQVGRAQLDRNVVLLGGPAKNRATDRFLAAVAVRHPSVLSFDDVDRTVQVGPHRIADYDVTLDDEGLPQRDLAVVVAAPNPFAHEHGSRALCCAGFTSYGTAEAARFLFEDLPDWKRRPPEVGRFRRIRWPRSFIAVIEIREPVSQMTGRHLLALYDLRKGSLVYYRSGGGE